jgi:hypothetical protein
MFGMADPTNLQPASLTLFTDAHIVRGTVLTRQRRVTDILNESDHPFLVLSEVVVDAFGSRDQPMRIEFAQVNLDAVLFAVTDEPVTAPPELRTPKVAEQALISVPPFRVVGRVHLLPNRDLREALDELTGRFIPVTDAMYWSDAVGEARQTAVAVAVNHGRAQILAPYREVDPWEGIDRTAPHREAAPGGPAEPASPTEPAGPAEPLPGA